MEFRLLYRGSLEANGSVADKQRIRRAFHPQLADLWRRLPLVDIAESLLDPAAGTSVLRSLRGFQFAPLVTREYDLVCDLDILFLRPEEPGALITQGGDIDNRLKTLLDALRMPTKADELPAGDTPQAGEDPFFCLLESDTLVTSLSIATDRLLEPDVGTSIASLVLRVRIKATRLSWNNMGLVG
jgi:hypothetical protein